MSAETIFFEALEMCVGKAAVLRKGPPVVSFLARGGVRLMSNHRALRFPSAVSEVLDAIYEQLGGVWDDCSPRDLTGYIDGMLTADHPLGPCLVEFDEEQHFSPFRLVTLPMESKVVRTGFDIDEYLRFCTSEDYYRRFLRKHRLRVMGKATQPTIDDLLKLIGSATSSARNGFIAPKPGFPFPGGRVAQRAYYDVLRDFLPLSDTGRTFGLKPTIRVSLFELEEELGSHLDRSPVPTIADALSARLAKLHDG